MPGVITPPALPQLTQFGRPILAIAGDSRAAQGLQIQNAGGVDQTVNRFAQGVGSWVEFLTFGAVYAPMTYNVAVSGSGTGTAAADTYGLLNYQIPKILALSPRPTHCLIQTITNDISAFGLTADQICTNLAAAASILRAAGIVPIILTDMPRTLASWSAAARNASYKVNRWLCQYAVGTGAVVIDTREVLVDPANANGDPLSGYVQSDGIHPTYLTAYAIGQLVVAYFNKLGLSGPIRHVSQTDVYDATNNPLGNLLPYNGLMIGSSGTNTGTGASGTVPSGWNNRVVSGTGTSVAAVVARSDAPGNWFQMTTSCSSQMVVRVEPISNIVPATGYSAGDYISMSLDISVSGASSLLYANLVLQDFDGTNFYRQSLDFKGGQIGGTWYTMPTVFSGRLHTDLIQINAASVRLVTRFEFMVNSGGSAIVSIGAANVSKRSSLVV